MLRNVKGKLFWGLTARRFYQHLVTKSNLIDTTFQKSSIHKMAGYWEHKSMVWAALKDARPKVRSLSIIWLDLANPYRSVPHVLILFALRRYKIAEDWITLVIKYSMDFWGEHHQVELALRNEQTLIHRTLHGQGQITDLTYVSAYLTSPF